MQVFRYIGIFGSMVFVILLGHLCLQLLIMETDEEGIRILLVPFIPLMTANLVSLYLLLYPNLKKLRLHEELVADMRMITLYFHLIQLIALGLFFLRCLLDPGLVQNDAVSTIILIYLAVQYLNFHWIRKHTLVSDRLQYQH
jgi:hypothetical protein